MTGFQNRTASYNFVLAKSLQERIIFQCLILNPLHSEDVFIHVFRAKSLPSQYIARRSKGLKKRLTLLKNLEGKFTID